MSRKHCGKRGNCSLRAKLEVYEIRASANKKLNAKKNKFFVDRIGSVVVKDRKCKFSHTLFSNAV